MRQTKTREQRNRVVKNAIKQLTKKLQKAIIDKNAEEASHLLVEFYSKVDKAVKRNLLHKNKAARLKSLYSRRTKGSIGAKLPLPKKNSSPSPVSKKE